MNTSYLRYVLITFISVVVSCRCENHALKNTAIDIPASINSLSEADDWSLPALVAKSPNSGLYDYPSAIQNPEALAVNVTWKALNPSEGVYDWATLDLAIGSGKPFWLRIFASDALHIPEWIKKKYPYITPLQYPSEGGTYHETFGSVSPGLFYPIWKSELENEFQKFLLAFRDKNYFQNPNFKFMYAPSAWRWNEWEVIFTSQLREDLGSVDNFFSWFKDHINHYTMAFPGYEYKLVFTGYPQMDKCEGQEDFAFNLNNLTTGNNKLTDYAIQKGMSVRVGAMEYYNGYCHTPSWGSGAITLNGKRYQSVDYTHPLHNNQNRILGTENEGFGDDTMIAETNHYFFVKMATLKAIYMGLNWLNMTDKCYQLAPDVVEYARKTMGKNPAQSPDAWVALREWQDVTYKGITGSVANGNAQFFSELNLPYRNWERFLIQRDVSNGGITKPTQALSGGSLFQKNNGDSFEAIRTDIQSNNRFIYFGLSDDFMFNNKKKVAIKVTYLDNNTTTWNIEYDAGLNGSKKPTETIANSSDGKWKTKTFLLTDAAFKNSQESQMDFRISNKGAADLTVRFVRVIKLEE